MPRFTLSVDRVFTKPMIASSLALLAVYARPRYGSYLAYRRARGGWSSFLFSHAASKEQTTTTCVTFEYIFHGCPLYETEF